MRRTVLALFIEVFCLTSFAQNNDLQSCGGKFFVTEKYSVYAGVYESYDEHTFFHRIADIPIDKPVCVVVDFLNGTITIKDKTSKISNVRLQLKPSNDNGDKLTLITFNKEDTEDLMYLEYYPYSQDPNLCQVTREEEGAVMLVMRLSRIGENPQNK